MSDHISVCVCTYRRDPQLARLLRSLAVQKTEGRFTFSIVVVDNDPLGPARAGVARLSEELGIPVAYDIEPERTIPAARNHAVRMATGNFIAIIDDDEIPLPDWLANLHRSVLACGADGGLGPILPSFEGRPPAWLVRSGLCDLPRWPTGTWLRWNQTRTGNVLLKKDVFDRGGLRFDETFRTGGSDQDFFRQAMAAGFRFVAVDEAPVEEVVPPERWAMSYWIRRAMVNGFNAWKYLGGRSRGLEAMAAALKSAAAVAVYGLSAPVWALRGTAVRMRCLEGGFYHLSRLMAAFGIELWKKRDF